MLYIPLTTTPVGWLILGLGGYALYKSGKRKGREKAAADQIRPVPEAISHEDETDNKGE